MDWFGNKKRAEKQKVLEKRLAELDARAVCANALAYCLLGAATIEQREVEAEMAAYLVAKRNGLTPRSESYLSSYKGALAEIDLYRVMRVANIIETAMGIAAHQLKAKA